MNKAIHFLFFVLLTSSLFGRDIPPCDNIDYNEKVRSVLLYKDDDQTSDPIIPLNDAVGRLTLSFDILDGDGETLNYTFVHCTNDWQPTDIQRIVYASGFDYDRIDDYVFSRNTLVSYVNYQLVFPKEDMAPLISGNYLLIVYSDDMTEGNIYFTRRFMVLDEKATVDVVLPRYADDITLSDTHQQLNVKAVVNDIMSSNVQQFTNLTIRQNGRWDNAAIGLKPSYTYPDYISFEHNPSTVFAATNQFRRFNTSNFRFQSENLARIIQGDDSYIIDVATCESRVHSPYVSYDDIHGEKVLYVDDENLDTRSEVDYAKVNFFYRTDAPLTHEDVYIMGAINDWCFNERNRMDYNYQLHGYTCSILLKQGYYNFMFVTLDRELLEISTELTAGNFWETNNLYHLYFYCYNANKGYDELIGYTTVSSH